MVQDSEANAATNWNHWPAEVKDHVYLDPKVCNIMAFMAVIMGLGLLMYKVWGV